MIRERSTLDWSQSNNISCNVSWRYSHAIETIKLIYYCKQTDKRMDMKPNIFLTWSNVVSSKQKNTAKKIAKLQVDT